MHKETVLEAVTAQAQGIRGEVKHQSFDSPDWAYTLLQGGAWAIAVLYAHYTDQGIDPQDVMYALELEKDMSYGDRHELVREMFANG
jgi:hypothetical protein